ncbi:hypothetical protein Tco_0392616 [Tanacetum coccineum]
MGDENPIRTLGDYSKPSHEGYRNTIELPVGNNVVPLRSDTIRLVQNGCSFHGLRSEDPNQHLKDFLKLVIPPSHHIFFDSNKGELRKFSENMKSKISQRVFVPYMIKCSDPTSVVSDDTIVKSKCRIVGDIWLWYRYLGKFLVFDGPEPQPLLNSPSLDVSLGDVIGPEPPIKPHSSDSSKMKVVDYLTTQIPPSSHMANSHPKGVYSYHNQGVFVLEYWLHLMRRSLDIS